MRPDDVGAAVGHLLTDAEDAEAAADDAGWDRPTWDTLSELGYPGVSIPLESGGSDGTIADAVDVLVACGRHRAVTPIADAGFIAGWLLAAAGLELSSDLVAVVPPGSCRGLSARRTADGWRLDGRLDAVPWASMADRLALVLADEGAPTASLVVLDPATLSIVPRRNLAGEPRDDLTLDDVVVTPSQEFTLPEGVDAAALEARGALARAASCVGAMLRARDLTRTYASERVQFGRPVAGFQAVAQSIAVVVEQVEQARIAVLAAALDAEHRPVDAAALASIAVGEAASVVAARSHQIHAAMGMTADYPLHHFTRRLRAWPGEYGTAEAWSRRWGQRFLTGGSAALWAGLSRPLGQSDQPSPHEETSR